MAGRPKKPLEDRIAEKEALISSLQTRIKSEQSELEALYNEKKLKDLESLSDLLNTSGLNADEITEAIESYISQKK
ncbi:hypothetical protein EDD76_103215 [Kineothrix alysoides]|uniref:Uncharacterized protein n=1 Tax=Kineothrix alysoides TaxID=1469948 RepID=A0A4R1R3L9_9FIRM|nr:hypothetical protein [Kineothrix alysoides]TCL60023.1 hypothetical protein EDD76_103215 [Kineothrix alysoides]